MTREGAKPGGAMPERLYALDALRATMLFLVVLFHAVLSYTTWRSSIWVFKDAMTTPTADFVVRLVHAFTLPTFFILAGFFSAMLYLRSGAEGFARNRALRIALPFAVGWIILSPLVTGGFIFARIAQRSSAAEGLAAVLAAAADGRLFFRDSTLHLWFMYDLMFFYAAALAIAPLVLAAPVHRRQAALAVFAAIVSRPLLRLSVLALASVGMLLMVGGTLYASLSFVPNFPLLLGYGLYFAVGWLLYLVREQIPRFERFAWTQLIAGLALHLFAPRVLSLVLAPLPRATIAVASDLIGGVVVWLLFFGVTGLFLRHFNRPSPTARYVSEASFWIYLVHLPLTIWLAGLFSPLLFPAWIKILMILAVTYAVGFATYDLFVRSTVIGSVLSGRRYPRAFFSAGPQSAPA